MNWKWPKTKQNNLNPWYTITRRIVFFPGMVISLCFFGLSVVLFYGTKRTSEIIRDLL